MIKVKMVQVAKNRWRIESEKGIVLLDDIILDNKYQATVFITNYVSSYFNWEFEVITL